MTRNGRPIHIGLQDHDQELACVRIFQASETKTETSALTLLEEMKISAHLWKEEVVCVNNAHKRLRKHFMRISCTMCEGGLFLALVKLVFKIGYLAIFLQVGTQVAISRVKAPFSPGGPAAANPFSPP